MSDKDIVSDAADWVNQLVVKLDGASGGVLEAEIGGQKVSAVLSAEVIKFFKENRLLLLSIGKDLFRAFLLLLSEKKEEQAFTLLLSKMEADAIIARMKMNASQLKKHNDDHDAFVAALKKWAIQTLTQAGTKLLVGLLL